MKKKSCCRTPHCLWIVAIISFITYDSAYAAPPHSLSGIFYAENSGEESDNLLLLQRLKQAVALKHEILEDERRLSETEFDIKTILEAKVKNQRVPQRIQSEVHNQGDEEAAEMLPVPSAIVQHGPGHSGKRTSYMALCHFKICNMGRKRQL